MKASYRREEAFVSIFCFLRLALPGDFKGEWRQHLSVTGSVDIIAGLYVDFIALRSKLRRTHQRIGGI